MIVLLYLAITCLYLILIGSLIIGFDRVPIFRLTDKKASTQFSIVIPFRDEAEQLPKLLASLDALNYPRTLFEVLLIDDASTDTSVEMIKVFQKTSTVNLRLLKNHRKTDAPKKDAITLAISKAVFSWILTTDADCEVPRYWLDAFDDFISYKNPKMVVGSVQYSRSNNFLERFQCLDVLSLQASTIGAFGIGQPFLCNGANLAYTKDLFHELNGFEGNGSISSGDDIFMLDKAVKANKQAIGYLKNEQAVVKTHPEPYWAALYHQRVRWSAKTSHYKSFFGKLTGFIVLIMNAALVSAIPLVIVQGLSLKFAFYILVIKLLIDFLLIYKSARFFNQESVLLSYVIAGFIYPFFSVTIAFSSVFKGFRWKGRQFSK